MMEVPRLECNKLLVSLLRIAIKKLTERTDSLCKIAASRLAIRIEKRCKAQLFAALIFDAKGAAA